MNRIIDNISPIKKLLKGRISKKENTPRKNILMSWIELRKNKIQASNRLSYNY